MQVLGVDTVAAAFVTGDFGDLGVDAVAGLPTHHIDIHERGTTNNVEGLNLICWVDQCRDSGGCAHFPLKPIEPGLNRGGFGTAVCSGLKGAVGFHDSTVDQFRSEFRDCGAFFDFHHLHNAIAISLVVGGVSGGEYTLTSHVNDGKNNQK